MNRKQILYYLTLVISAMWLLVACATQDAPAAESMTATAPSPVTPTALPAPVGPEQQRLPPPSLVTVPSDGIEIDLEGSTIAGGENNGLYTESIPPDEVLLAEVDSLLESIIRGEILFSSPAGESAGMKTAYTYRDLDGDGVDDLVIVIVADQGGVVAVSAGINEDGSAVKMAPGSFDAGDSVQASGMDLSSLTEIVNFDDENRQDLPAVVMRLVGDRLEVISGLE